EVGGGQRQIGQRVGAVGVEPGGNQHPGGGEPVDHRPGHVVDGPADDVAGGPRGERHIDGEPPGARTTDVVGPAGAGVQRPLVGGHEQDVGPVPEGGLGAVAVDRPEPGYSGHWWVDTNRTSGRSQKAAWVPLPWWTSQSTTSTRSPSAASAAAATAMWLTRQ